MSPSASRRRFDLDVAAFIGQYPFRHLPHPDAASLDRVLEREGIARAWVGFLPSAWHRDPAAGNDALFEAIAPHADRLRAAPVVRPDWPGWEQSLHALIARGAEAIRVYPSQIGLDGDALAMRRLAGACAGASIPLLLTTRFEDVRQRHAMDSAPDLSAASVRALARSAPGLRLVVIAAGRAMIEEVHWGLTAEERERVWWDISWIWGPPEEDLAHLFATIGPQRFVFGSMWPLRLVQSPIANLELLPPSLQTAVFGDPRGDLASRTSPDHYSARRDL